LAASEVYEIDPSSLGLRGQFFIGVNYVTK